VTPPAIDLARRTDAEARQRVTILGVGNTLLSDEGIGIHVIRHLQRAVELRGGIELIDGGTLSFNLLPVIEAAGRLIVIDAANLGGSPGSVRCFVGDDLDRFLGGPKHTAHEIGLRELFDMARLDGHLPACRALIGVQPRRVDWGETPTEPVAAALPHVAELAIDLADKWCRLPIEDTRRV
jgi:hydrogenase maturation protease